MRKTVREHVEVIHPSDLAGSFGSIIRYLQTLVEDFPQYQSLWLEFEEGYYSIVGSRPQTKEEVRQEMLIKQKYEDRLERDERSELHLLLKKYGVPEEYK